MELLALLRTVIDESVKVLTFGAGIQNPVRRDLIGRLRDICSRCESAYSAVRSKLSPVGASYADTKDLISAMRSFAKDPDVNVLFQPEHLCRDIDQLLDDMQHHLRPTIFALDLGRINVIRQQLARVGFVDDYLRIQFNCFTQAMQKQADALCTAPPGQLPQMIERIQEIVGEVDSDLAKTIRGVRAAKRRIILPKVVQS